MPSFSQWIPIKLTSSTILFYSTPPSGSIPLQLSSGSPSTALFPFLNMYLHLEPSFSLISRPYAVSLLFLGLPLRNLSLSSAPSHLCFTRIVSFSKTYQLNLPKPYQRLHRAASRAIFGCHSSSLPHLTSLSGVFTFRMS